MSFSLPYFLGDGNVTPSPSISAINHQSGDNFVENFKPVQWSVENGLLLKEILNSIAPNFLIPSTRVSFPSLSENFRANLERLLISLKSYYDSSNPRIPQNDLIDYLCEKEAAAILKRIRIKAIMTRWDSSFVEEPDWYKSTPYYPIYEIGDIFYYKYAFFWEEECEDYLEQLEPVVVNDETVELFKNHLKIVIKNELDDSFDFEEEEFLLAPRSSKVIKSNYKSEKDYLVRYNKVSGFRSGRRLPGKRCVIPVHPGGVRDTIINQIEDLNTITALDKYVSRLMRNCPQTVSKNIENFDTQYSDMFYKYEFFYCRDIKKEGITKPRYLLKIMLRELIKEFPRMKKFISEDFFDADWCYVDGQVIHSDRGHGLGMANSLTTLFQIVVYNMVVDRFQQYSDRGEEFSQFFTLNDDCIFALNMSEEDAFEFSQTDHEILEDLGVIRNKTKSFLARKGGVFLEKYLPLYINKKESIERRTMLLPYICSNIVHAKELFSLIGNNHYYEEIISKFGYEFFPEEIHLPRTFGGWFSTNFHGVEVLDPLPFTEFTSKISRASMAVLNSDKELKRKIVKCSQDPFSLLYHDVDAYIMRKIPSPIFSFGRLERLSERSDLGKIFSSLKKKREFAYLNGKQVDFSTFITELLSSADHDIIVSENIESSIYNFDINKVAIAFQDPYRYSFPLCSAKRKIAEIKSGELPSSFWPITQYDSSLSTSAIRKEIAEMNLDYYAYEYNLTDVVLPLDEDEFQKFYSSWKNPAAVANYCSIKLHRLILPKIKLEGLKYRENYFSRKLNRLEFLYLNGKSFKYIENYILSNLSLEEFDELEKTEKEESESSSSSSDDLPPDDYPPMDYYPEFKAILFNEIKSKIVSKPEPEPEPIKKAEVESLESLAIDFVETLKNPKPKKTILDRIISLMPEGWDLQSFLIDDNIVYVLKNLELFDDELLNYLDQKVWPMDYARTFRSYQNSMRGPWLGHQDEIDLCRKSFYDQSPLIERAAEELREEARLKAAEEVEFSGDFDIDWE